MLPEVVGNIWDYYNEGKWIVIPTNGFVTTKGLAVMGKGLALQAKNRFSTLQRMLGNRLTLYGNSVFAFENFRLITFPVKRVWYEKASLDLIKTSVEGLSNIVKYNSLMITLPVYLPRVGCGNGGLEWQEVKPLLQNLDETKFVVCDLKHE